MYTYKKDTTLKEDIKFGLENENFNLSIINDRLKEKENLPTLKLKKIKNQFYEFDFSDKKNKCLVELKTRKVTRNAYPTSMIGFNKIEKGLKKLKKNRDMNIFIVFNFTDRICYHKLSLKYKKFYLKNVKPYSYKEKPPKDYLYFPVKQLQTLYKKVSTTTTTVKSINQSFNDNDFQNMLSY